MIGSPLDREFRKMVSKRLIPNCPITVKSFDDSKSIFGPDLAGVRGRTTRSKPAHIHVEYLQIPRSIVDRSQEVILAVNVMFVDEVPFLVSVARGINLITAEFTPVRTAKNLAANITHILQVYVRGGFKVSSLPPNCHLFPVNHLVGDTWVIGIDHASLLLQIQNELLVEQ
jgi:hypothetical protein